MKRVLCIDVGGTSFKYGLVGKDVHLTSGGIMNNEAQRGGTVILDGIRRIVSMYDRSLLSGVSISTTGVVDTERGVVVTAASHLPGYAGTRIREAVEKEFLLPCEVENDASCAGLAEVISGAAKGSEHALMVTLGTGVGCTFVNGGKILHGAGFGSCELGMIRFGGSDINREASTSGIIRRVREKKTARGADPGEWNGFRVFEGIDIGDEDCIEAVDETMDVLGWAISAAVCLFDPDTVVIGGGVMNRSDYLLPRIEAAYRRHIYPESVAKITFKAAHYLNDAGMIGAYYHFAGKHQV